MQKYTLFTWPDSQEFIGNPLCVLICPPEDDINLDSSYMVPFDVADPVGAEKIYLRLEIPESQNWRDKQDDEDNVLFDYDGHTFVEESLYRTESKKSEGLRKASYDVCFIPMTNIEVMVKDPLHPTKEELRAICSEAAIKILDNSESYMTEENVQSVELYDEQSGMKTKVKI